METPTVVKGRNPDTREGQTPESTLSSLPKSHSANPEKIVYRPLIYFRHQFCQWKRAV